MVRQLSNSEYSIIQAHGPRAEFVPTNELVTPALAQTAIAASGSWTSELISADGFYDFAFGATLSQAGQITLLRYLDDVGTVAVDAGQSQSLAASTLATLFVQDGKPCSSYQVKITNSSGTLTAAVSKFAALLSAH